MLQLEHHHTLACTRGMKSTPQNTHHPRLLKLVPNKLLAHVKHALNLYTTTHSDRALTTHTVSARYKNATSTSEKMEKTGTIYHT